MQFKLLLSAFLLSVTSFAQTQKGYEYTVDLTKVVDDKLFVELSTPPISEDEIIFYLPKIIPGTYAVEDYGRFVSKFKAVDKRGKALGVLKLDTNSWRISGAKKLVKISYWIEDSFDTKKEGPEIFWPAGTNIEEGKNYIVNPSGFFGYFEGMKQTPYTFNIIRDKDFYGSTGLIPQKQGEPLNTLKLEGAKPNSGSRVDVFQVEDYDRLADSPLMYAKADTALINVAGTEVLIGSYSPNGKISAREIANSVREVLMAQKEYLGGKLPVEKYAFIFYFTDKPITSYGALEHSYSSFYFMPERTIEQMNQNLRDFAAHEFFHIVTPLNIHSEEIGHFDFNNPKMSRHLWLYEGVTEYFAGNMQVKYGLITPEEYLNVLRSKMLTADGFKDNLPFTELSERVLDDDISDQYYNVYMKGALIGLCVDLKLRKLSDGKYGLQNLIADLSKKFGKDKAFEDKELFSEIAKLTYPEMEEFLNKYVSGPESLPLEEELGWVGVKYEKEKILKEMNLGLDNGNISVTQYNEQPMISLQYVDRMNEQGKLFGFKNGDILTKINHTEIPPLGPETSEFISRQKAGLKEGDTLSYTVLRKDEAGEYKEVELDAPVKVIAATKRHVLSFDVTATPEQVALRKGWLSAN